MTDNKKNSKNFNLKNLILNIISCGFYNYLHGNQLRSGLENAVRESDLDQVIFFLEEGAEANDLPILKTAIFKNNKLIIELLLSHGGKADISPPLMDKYDGKYHTFSETHKTYPLLEIAIENEDILTISLLLKYGLKACEGLFQALKTRNIKVISLLIDKTTNEKKIIHIFKRFFFESNTKFNFFYDKLNIEEHLIWDKILLLTAIYMKDIDGINLILTNYQPDNDVLFDSVKDSNYKMFCLLLNCFLSEDCDVDLNLIRDDQQKTLLHEIAINGTKEQAVFLLNKSNLKVIDINAIDKEGHTPLYYALANQNQSVAHFLESIGANL
ncbi:ankyrin repeat domain-containing protein [Candidatus Protochlamydia phocaeensis]|uniref:ankyrin repeat domain-containing protein n=1 Tax=Candidatus Protochlamydia phocaeensis TaxID=1414722 RepID=UPI0008390F3E|nr:ankyrin repeat domain-containing protein [Candidatus Protochlamydia phocaeensis]